MAHVIEILDSDNEDSPTQPRPGDRTRVSSAVKGQLRKHAPNARDLSNKGRRATKTGMSFIDLTEDDPSDSTRLQHSSQVKGSSPVARPLGNVPSTDIPKPVQTLVPERSKALTTKQTQRPLANPLAFHSLLSDSSDDEDHSPAQGPARTPHRTVQSAQRDVPTSSKRTMSNARAQPSMAAGMKRSRCSNGSPATGERSPKRLKLPRYLEAPSTISPGELFTADVVSRLNSRHWALSNLARPLGKEETRPKSSVLSDVQAATQSMQTKSPPGERGPESVLPGVTRSGAERLSDVSTLSKPTDMATPSKSASFPTIPHSSPGQRVQNKAATTGHHGNRTAPGLSPNRTKRGTTALTSPLSKTSLCSVIGEDVARLPCAGREGEQTEARDLSKPDAEIELNGAAANEMSGTAGVLSPSKLLENVHDSSKSLRITGGTSLVTLQKLAQVANRKDSHAVANGPSNAKNPFITTPDSSYETPPSAVDQASNEFSDPESGYVSGDVSSARELTFSSKPALQDSHKDMRSQIDPASQSVQAVQAHTSFEDSESLTRKVERVLGSCMSQCAQETEYWNRMDLVTARASRSTSAQEPFQGQHTEASFTSDDISFPTTGPRTKGTMTFMVETFPKTGRSIKKRFSVPTTPLDTRTTRDVPNSTHYVDIKHNILSMNARLMHQHPFFDDDFDYDRDAVSIKALYSVDVADFPRKLLRLMQAQHYEQAAERAIAELGCTWPDIIRACIDPHVDVGSDLYACNAILHRDSWYDEDRLSVQRTALILSKLPPSGSERNATAAVLCDIFRRNAKFSLWQIARKRDPAKVTPKEMVYQTVRDRMCRICFREFCPTHGRIAETENGNDSDERFEPDVEKAWVKDIIDPLNINYHTGTVFPEHPPGSEEELLALEPKGNPRCTAYWQKYDLAEVEKRGPFQPCSHPGVACKDARCSCWQKKLVCEKSCACSPGCLRRFRGCACKKHVGKADKRAFVCFQDDSCLCFSMARECDPDLCGNCGVHDVLHPDQEHKAVLKVGRCNNASLQLGQFKQTLLGESDIHGFGLYACEDMKKHDFLAEYVGEIITASEADRRGAVYHHQKLSYLFSLSESQDIDSTYFGNKTRFINHIAEEKANIYPRVRLVNTVHRIALFVAKPIKAGDELFFDYGHQFPDEELRGEKEHKKPPAPHARDSLLGRSFWNANEIKDADGHRRMKKTTRGPGRPRSEDRDYVGSSSKTSIKKRTGNGGSRVGAGVRHRNRTRSVSAHQDADRDMRTHSVGRVRNEEDRLREEPQAGPSTAYTSEDKIEESAYEVESEDDEEFQPALEEQSESGGESSAGVDESDEEDEAERPPRRPLRDTRGRRR